MRKLVTGLLGGVIVLIGGLFVLPGRVHADTACDSYAIMHCGASSKADFITKAKADQPGDLKAIYSDFGLVPASYAKFATNAKVGTIYKDGHIEVNGVTVGRSTLNISRVHDSKFTQAVKIGDKTYWGGSFGSTYHADTASVWVLFNDKGVMQFAVLSSCGNPQRIVPNKPQYSCDLLKKKSLGGNNYSFTTKATAASGATVSKVVYDFGDGTSATTTSLTQPVTHTFSKSATVRVTVYVKLPGGGTQSVTSADCATTITVTPPKPASQAYCSGLKADLLDSDTRQYRFTATGVVANGAVLQSATFDFGDKTPVVPAQPGSDNTVVMQHNYAQAGNYTATATLHFVGADGKGIDSVCQSPVAPAQTVTYRKPGVVTGSPDCTPKQLINTGPGTAIASVFGGTALLAAGAHYFIRRRVA